ncbi:hypothetical protein LTR36_002564 [Oleoguttula mirabilis]|uniref:Uncharacterized protein n=1 Tax=Oleoguttula mirabilis TaxID=1507867 RepID=A0AAV9JKA2_9PEZI|nr:hypothetical protein LTR36_002564 [Oleoguttula mirabilis]
MNDHRALPAIARAGTGLANIAPPRSRTDPPTQRPDREKSHLHRRLHANTITGKGSHTSSHRHRDKARDTVQSAIDFKPPISFDSLLRRDKKSPESSRRGSGSQQQQRDVNEWRAQQQAQAEQEARRRVRPEDVAQAKAENAAREEELRQSLKDVEEVGMSSTRQLDDTYYAILEKASILRSTVASLQQLAEASRRMQKQFQGDAQTLEQETRRNIEGFGDFEEQERAIDQLVAKLKGSKSETERLNERLEAARYSVEAYEARDMAKRAKRRKQWKATWGTVVGVLVLLVALLLLKHRRHVAYRLEGVGTTLLAEAAGELAEIPAAMLRRPAPSPSEDPYLRKLFDEL